MTVSMELLKSCARLRSRVITSGAIFGDGAVWAIVSSSANSVYADSGSFWAGVTTGSNGLSRVGIRILAERCSQIQFFHSLPVRNVAMFYHPVYSRPRSGLTASSPPVESCTVVFLRCRSFLACHHGGIGRRAWFRSMYSQGCGGSSPSGGTNPQPHSGLVCNWQFDLPARQHRIISRFGMAANLDTVLK